MVDQTPPQRPPKKRKFGHLEALIFIGIFALLVLPFFLIGTGSDDAVPTTAEFAPGTTPEETLTRYFQAMEAHADSPDLALYTGRSRSLLAQSSPTREQMDRVVESYRDCQSEPPRFDAPVRLAVIRYPADQTLCAPFFLVHDATGWQLDLAATQTAIRFGRSNAWHFAPDAAHDYGFGFSDWSFDDQGFPVP